MSKFENTVKSIQIHSRCLVKGFVRMVFGALTAGLFALAAYGFIMITTESGWIAVSEFVGSTATTVVALVCMYAMGGNVKKGAKK